MNPKKWITNNLSLKLLALLLALLVWTIVVGQARAYSEKTLEVGVTYHGAMSHIDVRDVQPGKVLVRVYGISEVVEKLDPTDVSLNIDLKDVKRAGESAFFSEDYLKIPAGLEIRQIQPRIVRVISDEFSTREVPVRIIYKGHLPKGVRLLDRRLSHEQVVLFGYLSQIIKIDRVEGEWAIDLGTIDRNKTVRVPLLKEDGVIRFEGVSSIDVTFEVDSPLNGQVAGSGDKRDVE
jgi:YbbR domain-containing protein